MTTSRRPCPDCRAEQEFEQPPCADDHGGDCPEWICTVCGVALMAGFDVTVSEPEASRRTNAA